MGEARSCLKGWPSTNPRILRDGRGTESTTRQAYVSDEEEDETSLTGTYNGYKTTGGSTGEEDETTAANSLTATVHGATYTDGYKTTEGSTEATEPSVSRIQE